VATGLHELRRRSGKVSGHFIIQSQLTDITHRRSWSRLCALAQAWVLQQSSWQSKDLFVVTMFHYVCR
jgi:hypothetical protein